jgi:copper transport protein
VLRDTETLRAALGEGLGWQCLFLVVAAVAATVAAFTRDAVARVLAAASVLLIGVGFAEWGHARTAEPAALALVGDVVHVMGAAVWSGGLVLLAWVLIRRLGDAEAGVLTVSRFSTVAGFTVLAVLVGGGAIAFAELDAVSDLWDDDYGRVLALKLAIVAFVLVLAAWNRFKLVPAIVGAPEDGPGATRRDAGWRHLRSSVAVEAVALLLVVGVTTVLVEITPPASQSDAEAVEAPAGGPFHGETAIGDTTLTIDVEPGEVGPNGVHLYYLGADGALVDGAESVTLEFVLPSAGLGPIEREAEEILPGHFSYTGNDLSIAGEWEITVVSRISRFEEERSVFTVPVG